MPADREGDLDDATHRALFEHVPTMLWRARPDAGRDAFSGSWLAFTGRSLAQELGDGWTEGVHPNDRSACLATCRDHVQRRLSFDVVYRLRRRDGLYRTVRDRGLPYHEPPGVFVGFVGSCAEVEDHRGDSSGFGAEDFFEMSLDHLCVAGFDGHFKRVNPSWTRTLGWTAEELLSTPSIAFVHPDDREATLAGRDRLRASAPLGPLVNRYVCKDGSYRWFEWRSVADAGQGLVYAAARDITEQMQSESPASRPDPMPSVDMLAAGVAHEINNPLAAVMANISLIVDDLQVLEAQTPAPALRELREMSLDVKAGAERIRMIVRGLKTLGSAEAERRLDTAEAAPPLASHGPSMPAAHGAGGRGAVLLVDDDAAVGTALRRILRDHDVTVTTAAREALALIEEGRRFDVILSDLMMPEMTGAAFHAELTRRLPEAADRVVFVSGGASTPDAQAFLDRVANRCIDKPFDPDHVREIVRQLVQKRSA